MHRSHTAIRLSCLALTVVLGVAAGAWAQTPASTQPPAQRLDGVEVKARPDPMARSKRRLDHLKKSLPELGSDVPRKPDAGDRITAYLAAHRDPNQATGEQRRMMQRAVSAPQAAGAGAESAPR